MMSAVLRNRAPTTQAMVQTLQGSAAVGRAKQDGFAYAFTSELAFDCRLSTPGTTLPNDAVAK